METSKFNEKLNKLEGNIYTVEEEVTLTDGLYEASLAHDNVNKKTLNIYTGSQLTGTKIENYFLSTPSETPWKYIIKILAPNVEKVYISYETIGDQVEAEDINNIQNEIVRTQETLNAEIDRAENAEEVLTNNLDAETNRAKSAENDITNVINTNKPNWDDKYSRAETDNKISALVTSLDWKEAVNTFTDLATTYPNAEEGWTVNVKSEDTNYQFNGTDWKDIGISAIPLATNLVDGKMSKQDKIDHDDMNSKKHAHINKSILDIITQALLDKWNAAYTHITDAIKHITPEERALWNNNSNTSNVVGDLTTSTTTNKTSVVAITNEINASLLEKANDTDAARTTTNKTVTGSINELNSNKASNTDSLLYKGVIADGSNLNSYLMAGIWRVSSVNLVNAPVPNPVTATVYSIYASGLTQQILVDNTNGKIFSRINTGIWKSYAYGELESVINPTMINGFNNAGTGVIQECGYYKDNFNIVHLQGVIYSANAGSNLTIFTLPAGYRPNRKLILNANNETSGIVRINILTTGEVQISGTNNTSSIILDGITFRV